MFFTLIKENLTLGKLSSSIFVSCASVPMTFFFYLFLDILSKEWATNVDSFLFWFLWNKIFCTLPCESGLPINQEWSSLSKVEVLRVTPFWQRQHVKIEARMSLNSWNDDTTRAGEYSKLENKKCQLLLQNTRLK